MKSGLSTFLLLIVVLAGFGALLWMNSGDATLLAPILPTESQPTENADVISQLLQRDFGDNATPLPTIEIPQIPPTRPVLAQPVGPSATPISAGDVESNTLALRESGEGFAATPTLPPATAIARGQQATLPPERWAPPPLPPPLSRDPLGRDHIYFRRPIESNANTNAVLYYYSYGADGQNDARRIHHGVDIPNPIGETVYAAWSGTVRFASDSRGGGEFDSFQNSDSYGNAVFVEHDIGYQGRRLYTLYAHLSAALVQEGDYVEAGQAIALIGETGDVTGPHLHFEVRMAELGTTSEPRYGDTYNPVLWTVPYVGHGIVAGRVVDASGNFIDDALVTFRSVSTGLLHPATVTTYVFAGTVNDVNSDPVLRENFAIGDLPVGRYDVIVEIEGQRVVNRVEVFEGIVSFIELKPSTPTTPESDDTATETAQSD